MSLKQCLGFALLFLLCSAMALFAQDAPSLKLSGRVTDSTGAGLPAAELEIVNYDGNSKDNVMVTSGADRRYNATVAAAGFYIVKAKRDGFALQTTDAIEVKAGTAGATLKRVRFRNSTALWQAFAAER